MPAGSRQQEAFVAGECEHHQVAKDLDDRRGCDGLLVTPAVRDSAGKDRQDGLHQCPDEQQVAVLGHVDAQAALGHGVLGVETDHSLDAVEGQALDHLHAAYDPEDVGEGTDGREQPELLDLFLRVLRLDRKSVV